MSDVPESSRRHFLKTSAGCLGGAFALCAMLPEPLRALPIHVIDGAGGATERTYPIPAADSVNVDGKVGMILVRAAGKVYAFSMSCPHERAAVKWVAKDHRFACTKHDSKYQADGAYISGRSTRSLDRFPIRRDGDTVVVTLDSVFRIDKDPGGYAAAAVAV
jgi:nitrite reductase/ring-hydroxylating ferredoxin subunit